MVASGSICRSAPNSRGEENFVSGRGVVVADVNVETPLVLRLRLVFLVAVAEARHHEGKGETSRAPLVQLLPRAQLVRHVCLRRHILFEVLGHLDTVTC